MFLSRFDCYPLQRADGSYTRVLQPLTQHIVVAHLRGVLTIGAYALDAQSSGHWVCLDADEEDQWTALKEMARHLEAQGITAYIECSSRGGHVWLFTRLLPGATLRRFGKALIQKYHLPSLELYPKQDQLVTGVGSLVRLPFGIHRKTGKRYSFITSDDQPLAPTLRQQLVILARPTVVPEAFINAISAEYVEPTPLPSKHTQPYKVTSTSGETLSERLKNVITVYDFVSHYVELDRNGRGLCPFHDDHRQSFQVHQERNFWHCYAGCGGGSLIDFWTKWREIHGQDGRFTATIKDLASLLL